MNQPYQTEDLIQILQAERQACLRGERLHLTKESMSSGHPVIDQFLKTDGLQKYTAYQGFKSAVHHYPREHNISGLVQQTVEIDGDRLEFPASHYQLLALPQDLQQMREAVPAVLAFWQRLTAEMDIYLAVNRGKDFVPLAGGELDRIISRTEWATVRAWQRNDFLEILLQLGWGQPADANHWRAWPTSGSEYVHAVRPGCKPIC